MTDEQFQTVLNAALKLNTQTPSMTEAAVERILAQLTPLPRQKSPLLRIPNVLLDWQFAPAWSRVAALACCAMLGFVIGIAGLDRRLDRLDTPFAVADRADASLALFDPESFASSWP